MIIIGITGTDGAGKSVAVDYLVKEKGFTHYSARALLLDEIEKRGLERSRANMRIVANDLRREYGNDYLLKVYLRQIKENGIEKAVIESLRAVAEAETLKKNRGVLLAVDADQKIRYKRIVSRASESDKISFEEFVRQEKLEMDDPDPSGMQKAEVIKMADYRLINNGSIEELRRQVEEVLEKIESKGT